jgi:hypothetical protein
LLTICHCSSTRDPVLKQEVVYLFYHLLMFGVHVKDGNGSKRHQDWHNIFLTQHIFHQPHDFNLMHIPRDLVFSVMREKSEEVIYSTKSFKFLDSIIHHCLTSDTITAAYKKSAALPSLTQFTSIFHLLGPSSTLSLYVWHLLKSSTSLMGGQIAFVPFIQAPRKLMSCWVNNPRPLECLQMNRAALIRRRLWVRTSQVLRRMALDCGW